MYRGAVAADGTVTAWTAVTSLPVAHRSSGAAIFHGQLYVGGGATRSSEESYAQLGAAGVVGAFNGATGANTIGSLSGGANLFKHAAVGYTDGSGAFHVLVAGGDDVNAPGTKHNGVFFY